MGARGRMMGRIDAKDGEMIHDDLTERKKALVSIRRWCWCQRKWSEKSTSILMLPAAGNISFAGMEMGAEDAGTLLFRYIKKSEYVKAFIYFFHMQKPCQ